MSLNKKIKALAYISDHVQLQYFNIFSFELVLKYFALQIPFPKDGLIILYV